MKSAILCSILLSTSFLIASCSGGTSRRTDFGPGKRCAENYAPLPLEVAEDDKRGKVNWPEGSVQSGTLPSGEYEYVEMEFLVIDTNTGMMVHAKESKNAQGEFQVTPVCGRKMSAPSLSASLNLPAVQKIEPSGKASYETRGILITKTDKLELVSVVNPGSEVDAPSKVTEEQNLASQLYQLKSTDGTPDTFEVRVSSEDTNLKKYGILRFKKIN